MIGSDHPELLLHQELKIGKPGDPVAVKTKLGWMLIGGKPQLVNRSQCNYLSKDNISQNLEKFWQIDTYGTFPKSNPDIFPPEQKGALHILESAAVIKDIKFEVGLLWKKDNIILPYNRELAEKQLYSLKKKFTKNRHFKHLYEQQINDYHETSLNNNLLPGLDLLNNLVSILCSFRQGEYAVISDIKAMFHQMRVPSPDTDALRFLWRKGTDTEIEDYAMRVHVLGKPDSPCAANWVLKQMPTADDCQLKRIIEDNFYMDNFFLY